ncbi:50S ribosomal protein L10 [Halobacillus litoralis]|uniref:Large ribosomal subunit protein uL10 n=1 Tax=Halobacillus litoralis TaxID=45668 RepID=A0A845E039_9BACI|nr:MULTISPECIES: 50S ribosomal protein L10 [Halobacillus]MCA1024366.1 50S ribosomal protein L10 [Halobacillus litoralis]MYL21922.1 50S ribosomal protein L10 [Halobacillus litoralis]MYL31888.1 50S ribosomal protein L10 [Halobacillus halophilus]MYL39722.1 50S ribosomal protein L10 [Halobacillus litoralis]
MSGIIEQKKQIVSDLAEKFRNSKSAVLVDYRGLDVAEVTELRNQLREAGVEYKVHKNTMIRRAAAEVELSDLDEVLQGPTAIAFHAEDAVAPARILNNFAKDHEDLEIKGGVVEGQVATLEQIKEVANLPNYEGLVSMFLSVLQAPIRNFAYATQAVADQKEEESA